MAKANEQLARLQAAIHELDEAVKEDARLEAGMMVVRNRIHSVFSAAYSEVLASVRSKVRPAILPFCSGDDSFDAEWHFERIFSDLPRVGQIGVHQNMGSRGGKTLAADISAMLNTIAWLERTSGEK